MISIIRIFVSGLLLIMGAVGLFGFAYSQGLLKIPTAQAQGSDSEQEMSQETIRIELIEDIKKRQEELNRKNEELDRREERIRTLGKDLDKKIAELKRTQLKLEDLIKIRGDLEEKNITALSKTYAAMPPEEAASRLEVMNRGIALKILAGMKSKKAAQVLTNLNPETATEMTEQLAKRDSAP